MHIICSLHVRMCKYKLITCVFIALFICIDGISPLQGCLPSSISLWGEIKCVNYLHVLVRKSHFPHGRQVICFDRGFPLVSGCDTSTQGLGGTAQHSDDNLLELLMLLAEATKQFS